MKKYKLSEFQLSQSYLFYWDKIEKANYLRAYWIPRARILIAESFRH